MKKVISMLLFVATSLFATSCDEVEEIINNFVGDNEEVTYIGETTVSAYGVTSYTQESSQFNLTQADGAVEIEMYQIQFNENMPAMTIKISDIPTDGSSFSIDEVIPTLAGVPMESYAISDVTGTYNNESLTIDFVCLTLDVNFVGSVE